MKNKEMRFGDFAVEKPGGTLAPRCHLHHSTMLRDDRS
jgi:hypothetical protein